MIFAVYLATGLLIAAVMVMRFGRADGDIWRQVHVGAGFLAMITWLPFVIQPEDTTLGSSIVGIIGLFFWWWVAIAGISLMRAEKARGRRAAQVGEHKVGSSGANALHILALISVIFLTGAYAVSAV